MIVVPAVDLFEGKVVRLLQGRYDAVTVFDEEPAARASAWRGKVPWLHVVDLEGARAGRPVQHRSVRAVIEAFGPGVQVGGGIRSAESFEAYRSLGASRLVLGSAAVSDPELVRNLAERHPGAVVLAVDARDGLVAVDGWVRATQVRVADLVGSFADVPLGAVLYTDVARDGTRTGPNVDATAELARSTKLPVIASGGVGTLEHLRALSARGIAACIVGRALYEGAFTLDEAIEAAGATSA
ncbi:MAG TPA: 1-(5-phosphoribosyl)-5-[(5-phosphoribosylamino)methylideneamino]imidazole-4-carboxamide isomerase [Polyangiaceae bacterium]|nr:1-(5-phosphoribosyl)-5-[(5-phosphoribosylamino)methylideneamino]imidazole-4-carboxamide isomerase [Polyangiaceae bacterium]